MKEIWKDIPEYEGLYQVSNLGRIKSLERKVRSSTKDGFRIVKEKILTPYDNGRGYLIIRLSKQGKVKSLSVHQIVAITFLGHVPNGMKYVINHKDYNKQNNNATNLEIITQRENTNKKHLKSTSQFVGVYWNKQNKKWQTSIMINRKQVLLGCFDNELEAHFAYQTKLNEINRLNKAV